METENFLELSENEDRTSMEHNEGSPKRKSLTLSAFVKKLEHSNSNNLVVTWKLKKIKNKQHSKSKHFH